MTERDFRTEVLTLVEASLSSCNDSAATQAERLVTRLETEDPDLILGWAHVSIVSNMATLFAVKRGNDRNSLRNRVTQAFTDYTDAMNDPLANADELQETVTQLTTSLYEKSSPVVNDDGMTKPIGKLTGADHQYIAGNYAVSGNRSLLYSAFHKAIGEKVGNRTTEEVIDPEQYAAMLTQMVG